MSLPHPWIALAALLIVAPAAAATRPQVLRTPPRAVGFAACARAIATASTEAGLPAGLLRAVAATESGRPWRRPGVYRAAFAPPAARRLHPWPWTIDAGGSGQFLATRADAVAAVRALLAEGVRAIDVGCLQVDLRDHPDAFDSLRAAFDPLTNARWAARFLLRLHATLGSWPAAIAAYHSRTRTLGASYRQAVLARWHRAPAAAAKAYADFMPRTRKYADFAPPR